MVLGALTSAPRSPRLVGPVRDLNRCLPQAVTALAIAVIGWLHRPRPMRGVGVHLVAASGLDKSRRRFRLTLSKGNHGSPGSPEAGSMWLVADHGHRLPRCPGDPSGLSGPGPPPNAGQAGEPAPSHGSADRGRGHLVGGRFVLAGGSRAGGVGFTTVPRLSSGSACRSTATGSPNAEANDRCVHLEPGGCVAFLASCCLAASPASECAGPAPLTDCVPE